MTPVDWKARAVAAEAALDEVTRERNEHLRTKNNLVLRAYPAMDAVDRILAWIDGRQYENDLITVAQLRELLGAVTRTPF